MFEVVIVIAIALVVWLYMHLRKKKHASASEPGEKPVVAKTISPEPKPEPISEPKVEAKPEAVIQEPVVETETSEVADVIPEDSTLRRHYLQNLDALADISSIGELADNEVTESVIVPEDSTTKVDVVESSSYSRIPEDSALKRHFIQQLTAEITAAMPDRPTDSTLKRHYDAQLLSSVDSRLQALK